MLLSKIIVAVTYVVMVVVNILADTVPINGVSTGEVSAAYENLFAPAPYTFAIWGLIYILLGLFTLYYVGLFRKGDDKTILKKTGIWFAVSSVANAAWIISWHYYNIALSLLIMLVILASLIIINNALSRENLTLKEKLLIRIPFAVYFGWITVATVANITVFLVSIGWDGFGIAEPAWAVIILLAVTALGIAATLRYKSLAYGLTLVWAYIGILVKHVSESGFDGRYPVVITAVAVGLAALLATLVYVLISERKENGADMRVIYLHDRH